MARTQPTIASQGTQRQRAAGRWPSGKRTSATIRRTPPGSQLSSAIHSAASPHGQPCCAARSPYAWARSAITAVWSPKAIKSQPMGLRGRADATSAPITAVAIATVAHAKVS